MRAMKLTATSAAALFAISVAGCGTDASPGFTAAPGATNTQSAPVRKANPAPGGKTFGAGCAAVPKDPKNKGSFEAMAKVPVATAASGNPLLSTLVSAVKQADLVDSLNTAPEITVFAPINDAFDGIPKATLDGLLADKETLTKVLTYHVVPGKLGPDEIAGTHKTLQGGKITVAGSGTKFKVNTAATVVCGNVQTANATVYLIDKLLKPQS